MIQCSRFESDSIKPVHQFDLKTQMAQVHGFPMGNFCRLVGRVIKDLNFQFLSRIIDLANRRQQSLDDVDLVIDWQLNSDHRQLRKPERGPRRLVAVPKIKKYYEISMNAVNRHPEQHNEIA